MPSIAMVMMMMAASLLGAVPAVEGRECNKEDVFKDGDYTTATIPSDCTELHMYAYDDIGYIGARAIAEALKGNTALTELDLGYNDIGDIGATSLAEALKGNTALTMLGLQRNDIGDIGATALAKALKGNSALTTLNLAGNNIKDSTITASIAASLAENKAAKEEEERAAREPGIATLTAALKANPCGAYTGCEEVLGDAILAQFNNLDMAMLYDYGVTSALELLGFAVFHKSHAAAGGTVDPHFVLTLDVFEIEREADAHLFHILESLVAPLKIAKRKKLIKTLHEKVAKFDKLLEGNEETMDDFLSLFGLNKAAVVAATTTLPFKDWATKMHLPDEYVAHLEQAGVGAVMDLATLSEQQIFSEAMIERLKLVEIAYTILALNHHKLADGEYLKELFKEAEIHAAKEKAAGEAAAYNAMLKVAATAVTQPFNEWASTMSVPAVFMVHLEEELGIDELSDFDLLTDDEIFTEEFVKTLTVTELGKCTSVVKATEAALKEKQKAEGSHNEL